MTALENIYENNSISASPFSKELFVKILIFRGGF